MIARLLCLSLLLSLSALASAAEREVTPRTLQRWMERPDAPIMLDLRPPSEDGGGLPGALAVGPDPGGFRAGAGVSAAVLVGDASPESLAAWRRHLEGQGLTVWTLRGGLQAWREAGLPVTEPDTYTRPGDVPFVIPRGLCEMNTPAQQIPGRRDDPGNHTPQ